MDSMSADGMNMESTGTKVVIAIPAPIEQADWRWWSGPAHLLGAGYTDQFHKAGAAIVLLPVPTEVGDMLDRDAQDLISRVDGLVIAGGPDVDPGEYHEVAAPEAGPFNRGRDAWEIALTQAAIKAGVPIFGICRGHQLLNVVLGGSLIQHLPPTLGGSEIHNPVKDDFGTHPIRTVEGSWLRGAVDEVANVATYHHQAIDRLGDGLTVTATAEDGTIEGVEDLSRGLVGVQWHPEARDHGGVFQSFVRTCEDHRARRQSQLNG